MHFIFFTSRLNSGQDKPEELTPKVDNTSEDYLLPTGSILNAQDREEVQALWDEYNNAINQ